LSVVNDAAGVTERSLRNDPARANGVSGGWTVRNSAEGAVRFLRRRMNIMTPKTISPMRMRPPSMPPAMAPVWDGAARFDEGLLLPCLEDTEPLRAETEGRGTDGATGATMPTVLEAAPGSMLVVAPLLNGDA